MKFPYYRAKRLTFNSVKLFRGPPALIPRSVKLPLCEMNSFSKRNVSQNHQNGFVIANDEYIYSIIIHWNLVGPVYYITYYNIDLILFQFRKESKLSTHKLEVFPVRQTCEISWEFKLLEIPEKNWDNPNSLKLQKFWKFNICENSHPSKLFWKVRTSGDLNEIGDENHSTT